MAASTATLTPPTGVTQQQTDARAIVKQFLDQLGLSSEADWAWGELTKGATQSQIELDLYQRPAFQTRFAAIFERQKLGLPAISVSEYLQYEKQATALMQAAGLPKGFYDQPQDFTNFLVRDVSVSELQSRIQDGYVKASQAPPEVADQLYRFTGVGPGELAAYYLDPQRAEPILQRQFAMAQVSGAAVRTGYGQLAQTDAERLAQLGISDSQAQQGFGELQTQQGLFGSDITNTEDTITKDQQLAAEFGGNTDAQQAIERKRSQRKATFGGGGSFATSQQGFVGLGSAKNS